MAEILIIDDDAAIRELVATYLIDAGHDVRHAVNGQDGLDQTRARAPDLLILDLNMPVMDGTRVMRELRAAPQTQTLPVIALSAVTVPEMRDDMHQLGCDAYITKPIDRATLLGSIDTLLKR